jgi:hypothetical protein
VLAIAGVVVLAGAYARGRTDGAEAVDVARYVHARDSLAHQLVQIAAQRDSLSKVATAAHVADSAARVVATDATTRYVAERVRLDSAILLAPPPIVNLIRSADAAIAADAAALVKSDLAFRAQAAELVATRAERDTWKQRAELAENELERRRPPRFGFKSGVAVATVTIAILKLAF